MVGGADQGAGLGQTVRQALELGQGVDLPGQVVEADGAPPGLRGAGLAAPIWNRPRSWSLVEPGAWTNAAPGMRMTASKPSTSP